MQTKHEIEKQLKESAQRIGEANRRASALREVKTQQEPNQAPTPGSGNLSGLAIQGQVKGSNQT